MQSFYLGRILAWAAGLAVLVFSLIYLSHVWIYIIIALILSFMGAPLVRIMTGGSILQHRISSTLAAAVTLFGMLTLVAGLGWLIFPLVAAQLLILSSIEPETVFLNLETEATLLAGKFKQLGIWPTPEQWEQLTNQALNFLSFQQLGSYFGGAISFTIDLLIAVFSVLFISFYMLKEGGMAGKVLRAITPDLYLHQMESAMHESRVLLSRYFLGLLAQMSIVALVVASGLALLGVQYALTLGILAGIFNLIPYIGPYIGGSIGVFIAISAELALGGRQELLPYGLKIMGVFVLVQLLDNFVLQPIIFSKSVLAHPLEIFLVVLIAGSLFGITGMLAAIPVYTILRVVARAFFSQTKWVRALTDKMNV
jgi:predicted PurR-regulated permease PerM